MTNMNPNGTDDSIYANRESFNAHVSVCRPTALCCLIYNYHEQINVDC